MSKCPLCGSDGDDLVFRFYCLNGKCANYEPKGSKECVETARQDEFYSRTLNPAYLKLPREKEQGKAQARTKERLAPELKCPLFTMATVRT
jgi:hypothetical protein